MTGRLRLLLLALGLTACAQGQNSIEQEPTEGAFSVLTYNIHGLPSAITNDDTTARVESIAPRLNNFDVVGLQEDFIDENHAVLEDASEHRTKIRFAEIFDESRYYGSGLALFAPFVEDSRRHEHYGSCNGVLTAASDCLASKGFQAIRLRLENGGNIDFYNTHLEAGGGEADNEVRTEQVAALVTSLTTWSANQAVVFTGDFNLHADDPTDAPLLEQLTSQGQLRDSCEEIDCADTNHIDRIFVRSGELVELTTLSWAVEADFEDSAGTPLSDHPAISARIGWFSEP